jgi:hypothetical protein
MLNIKKYSNGRFFDTAAKKYIKSEKMAELVQKGEKIQVTLTKTGKDITESVIEQFSKKEKKEKEIPFLKTDKLVKWLGEVIDTKIEQVMEAVKLPTREQLADLDKNIKVLNKKIDALKLSQESPKKSAAPKKKPAAAKKTAPEDKTKDENKTGK